MAKKQPADMKEDASGDSAREPAGPDVVRLYARVVQTLENCHGRETLTALFSGLRQTDGTKPPPSDAKRQAAMVRSFRRLGLLDSGKGFDSFGPAFFQATAEAVSRTPAQVECVYGLFAAGDGETVPRPICGATPRCADCGLTRLCDYFNRPRQPEAASLPPAARLFNGYEDALSDAELLSVALFGERATGQETAATSLLERYGRLRALFQAEAREYAALRDVPQAKAARLAAIACLYRRLLRERRGSVEHIGCAKDLYDRYFAELREYKTEAAVLVLMDHKNGVIRDAWFGGVSVNVAHLSIHDLLRPAIKETACRVALVHNHPSGDPAPSASDKDFTRRLQASCDIFGLVMVDHVIVAEGGYYSFAEGGLLAI